MPQSLAIISRRAYRVLSDGGPDPSLLQAASAAFGDDAASSRWVLAAMDLRPTKLAWVVGLVERLSARGFEHLPVLARTPEGNVFARVDPYRAAFLVEDDPGVAAPAWSVEHVQACATAIMRFHRVAQGYSPEEKCRSKARYGRIVEDMTEKLRELNIFRTVAANKIHKTVFDRTFLEAWDVFAADARDAKHHLATHGYSRMVETSKALGEVALHDVSLDNFLLAPGKVGVLIARYDKAVFDCRARDYARMAYKIGQATGYDVGLLRACAFQFGIGFGIGEADAKDDVRSMETAFVCSYLLFPWEFWRIANRYYKNRKDWTEKRFCSELSAVIESRAARVKAAAELFMTSSETRTSGGGTQP